MARPSTPPHGRLKVPDTPQHGPMHDDYVPYSPRRSNRRTLHNNPYSSTNTLSNAPAVVVTPAKKAPVFGLGYAPSDCFSSPPASPLNAAGRMSKQFTPNTPRRADNSHLDNTAPGASDSFGPFSSVRKGFMLPTPTKTPTMTPTRKHSRAASMQDSARVLHFQPDDPNDSMPTRHQSRSSARTSKFRSLDFGADEMAGTLRDTNDFPIYTESHARVPALDSSEDNPFYRPRANTVPQSTCSSPPLIRKKTASRTQEEEAMHDAAARNEGMVYTFRGRKVFQKFTDSDNDADTELDARDPGATASQRALKRSAGAAAGRPLTRSQIKPRLLFPPAAQPLHSYTDEEAETDIEGPEQIEDRANGVRATSAEASVPLTIPATPAKTKTTSLLGTAATPSKIRGSRKRNGSEVPVYEDESIIDSVPAGLITPAQSSKKKQKHVGFADAAGHRELAPEPALSKSDSLLAQSLLTPQRSSRKKKIDVPLTPIVEDESETDSPIATSSGMPSTRTSRSPFDQWLRTKGGLKREGDAEAEGSIITKRTRSRAAANDT